ncbi:MAG: hypothetical protein AB8C13_02470 [Phycisphaerales bacterium]
MTINGNQLLSALSSGILPDSGSHAQIKQNQSSLSFEDILKRVERGEASGIGINLGKDIDPSTIDEQSRNQAGLAADRAAIKGIHHMIADLNGSLLRVDVQNRVIEAQLDRNDDAVLEGIDGYVSLNSTDPGSNQAATGSKDEQDPSSLLSHSTTLSPARIVRNQSLIDVLLKHG